MPETYAEQLARVRYLPDSGELGFADSERLEAVLARLDALEKPVTAGSVSVETIKRVFETKRDWQNETKAELVASIVNEWRNSL